MGSFGITARAYAIHIIDSSLEQMTVGPEQMTADFFGATLTSSH
jgi:hypothetical protein